MHQTHPDTRHSRCTIDSSRPQRQSWTPTTPGLHRIGFHSEARPGRTGSLVFVLPFPVGLLHHVLHHCEVSCLGGVHACLHQYLFQQLPVRLPRNSQASLWQQGSVRYANSSCPPLMLMLRSRLMLPNVCYVSTACTTPKTLYDCPIPRYCHCMICCWHHVVPRSARVVLSSPRINCAYYQSLTITNQ